MPEYEGEQRAQPYDLVEAIIDYEKQYLIDQLRKSINKLQEEKDALAVDGKVVDSRSVPESRQLNDTN